MKKLLSVLLVCVMLGLSLAACASNGTTNTTKQIDGGTTTGDWKNDTQTSMDEETATVITTVEQLQTITQYGNYVLGCDLDLGGMEWTPIAFSGIFDGNGYEISNFKITIAKSRPVGFFEWNEGTIKNLGITNFIINVSRGIIRGGGLVGLNQDGSIINCYTRGSISSDVSRCWFGGLVGYNLGNNVRIINCYSAVNITSEALSKDVEVSSSVIGGLIGSHDGGVVANSFAIGNLQGVVRDDSVDNYVGGLVGKSFYGGKVINCYRCESQLISVTGESDININEEGMATSSENLKSADWVKTNLWKGETAIWNFSGGYPILDHNIQTFAVKISTKQQLLALQNQHLTLKYVLTQDIDLDGTEWSPITCCYGVFDGKGHVISDFKITEETYVRDVGMFGMNEGIVRNLGLKNFLIEATDAEYVGGLIGYNNEDGTIENCYAKGNVNVHLSSGETPDAGGLVGNNLGMITGCYAKGDVCVHSNAEDEAGSFVSGRTHGGGLAGFNYLGTIEDCYATGNVSVNVNEGGVTGGLVGYCLYGDIDNCYATGDASSRGYEAIAGGLLGALNEGTVKNCYATGNASGISTGMSVVGGLVGEFDGGAEYDGAIENCYATGDVSISSNKYGKAGGLVADHDDVPSQNCYRYSGQQFTVTKDGVTTNEPTNTGGTPMDMVTLKSNAFHTNTLGWDTAVWNFVEGSHPTLK